MYILVFYLKKFLNLIILVLGCYFERFARSLIKIRKRKLERKEKLKERKKQNEKGKERKNRFLVWFS